MNPFKQLISDDSGAPSTMRVMGLIVVVPFMIVWTVLSIKTGALIIPDSKLVMLIGSAFAGKSVQSLFENFTGIHFSIPAAAAGTAALPGPMQAAEAAIRSIPEAHPTISSAISNIQQPTSNNQ